jgi:hypothetical protein
MGKWKAVIGTLLIVALAYGWLVAATAVYCAMAGKMDFFRFPYHQWLIAAPYYRANWYMTVCVIVSAAVPAAVAGFIIYAAVRLLRRQSNRPVYGQTQWATPQEMASGNIVRKQRNA